MEKLHELSNGFLGFIGLESDVLSLAESLVMSTIFIGIGLIILTMIISTIQTILEGGLKK